MTRWIKLLAVIGLGFVLSGCKETLNSGLGERDANEIVATLYLHDIPAAKVPGKDNLFSVSVRQTEFGAALAVLTRAGLPRESFSSIGDVFTDDSVVGTAFEERARFTFALSQEISRTLTEIEGVQYARVHVVIPEKGRFEDAAPPAKAAIALYHSSKFDPSVTLPQIKQLAASAVPNLSYALVSVALFPASELSEVVLEAVEPATIGSAANAANLSPFDLPQDDVIVLLALALVVLLGTIFVLKSILTLFSFSKRILGYVR